MKKVIWLLCLFIWIWALIYAIKCQFSNNMVEPSYLITASIVGIAYFIERLLS